MERSRNRTGAWKKFRKGMDNIRPVIELLELFLTVVIVLMIWREIGDNRVLTGQIEKLNNISVQTNENLHALIEKQADALASIGTTNDELKISGRNTREAALALQSQLTIIKQQQQELAAERAKKPKLVLYVNTTAILPYIQYSLPTSVSKPTETVLYVELKNDGNQKATDGAFKVLVNSKDVNIQNSMVSQTVELDPTVPSKILITPFQYILPTIQIPMTITLSYPKSQGKFTVTFAVDAAEFSGTQILGRVEISPPVSETKP